MGAEPSGEGGPTGLPPRPSSALGGARTGPPAPRGSALPLGAEAAAAAAFPLPQEEAAAAAAAFPPPHLRRRRPPPRASSDEVDPGGAVGVLRGTGGGRDALPAPQPVVLALVVVPVLGAGDAVADGELQGGLGGGGGSAQG